MVAHALRGFDLTATYSFFDDDVRIEVVDLEAESCEIGSAEVALGGAKRRVGSFSWSSTT